MMVLGATRRATVEVELFIKLLPVGSHDRPTIRCGVVVRAQLHRPWVHTIRSQHLLSHLSCRVSVLPGSPPYRSTADCRPVLRLSPPRCRTAEWSAGATTAHATSWTVWPVRAATTSLESRHTPVECPWVSVRRRGILILTVDSFVSRSYSSPSFPKTLVPRQFQLGHGWIGLIPEACPC